MASPYEDVSKSPDILEDTGTPISDEEKRESLKKCLDTIR